jgi:CII-binding regulator of phage lambda lysogenization HflD
MNISEIVESKGYKNFMKYVYGWGASVVLIGALFKILHLPGSSIMLGVGLTVEALIFFFSGFEPLHEELDWTLVYPELAGLSDEFDEDETQVRRFDRANEIPQGAGSVIIGGGIVGGAVAAGVAGAEGQSKGYGTGGSGQVVYGGSPSAMAKFDEMLMKADIGPEIFDKLGQGLTNLSNTASKLADLGDASAAAKDFTTKMQNASTSVAKLDEVYTKSTEALKESVNTLSESYSNSAQSFNQTNSQLAESYSAFASKLTQEINTIGNEGSKYSEKLGSLNSNLSSLNAVYELQIKNLNAQVESSSEYFKGLNGMVDNIHQTVEHTNKLNEGVKELEKNISSLNSIYGNMLSSVNFNK